MLLFLWQGRGRVIQTGHITPDLHLTKRQERWHLVATTFPVVQVQNVDRIWAFYIGCLGGTCEHGLSGHCFPWPIKGLVVVFVSGASYFVAVVYVDGCCRGNHQYNNRTAGIGVWWGRNHPL